MYTEECTVSNTSIGERMVLLIRQKQDDRAPHSPVTAVQGDCKNTSASKMLNVTMPIGSDVKHNRNSQCNSRNDSHVKLQYLSLETINVTKDVSTLSRNHDEKDEVLNILTI